MQRAATKKTAKRRWRFRGICADARALGVHRNSLYKVLAGERQSRSLLARWESLKAEQTKVMSEETNPRFSLGPTTASAGEPQALDPAAANETIEWVGDVCAKIGLTAVVVQAPYSLQLWQNSGFEERLGEELGAAHLGHYANAKFGNPISFFFYVASEKLVEGLQFLEARVSGIGLLPQCKIGYADLEAKVWRLFYPRVEKAGS
jgi:hypothetical protein